MSNNESNDPTNGEGSTCVDCFYDHHPRDCPTQPSEPASTSDKPNDESKTLRSILVSHGIRARTEIGTDPQGLTLDEALTAITALMEQVIGDGGVAMYGNSLEAQIAQLKFDARERLRAEQRQRLQQLMGERGGTSDSSTTPS